MTSELKAKALKKSFRRSRSKFATRVRISGTLNTRKGRPEMSREAETRASSMGTDATPNRTIPFLSPTASLKALPRQIPTSSTVWCRSTSVSPRASTVRSTRPCLAHASSMWLKNGIVVSTLAAPLPSRLSWSRTSVSRVFRSIRAWRGTSGSPPRVGRLMMGALAR